MRILRLVRECLAACGLQSAALADADAALNLTHPDLSNEAAERVLQIAQSLWRNRPPSCPAPEVLPPLMHKLAQ